MIVSSSWLALPTSLLLLLASSLAQAQEYPYNLPRTVKYFPEHHANVKRDAEIRRQMDYQQPKGVKKMGEDEGQKFFLDYWSFEAAQQKPRQLSQPNLLLDLDHLSNFTLAPPSLPAIVPHTNYERRRLRIFGRDIFARDFECPEETKSCADAGFDDFCCRNDETCVSVSSGVGCCPSGQTCGNEVTACDEDAGYTSCQSDDTTGCCVPGAECEGSGCIFYGTRTITTTLPVETRTTGSSVETEIEETTEIVVVSSGYTTTQTVTETKDGSVTTRTITRPETTSPAPTSSESSSKTEDSSTCTSGFFSCPESLDGGCCRNGQACASGAECEDMSSTSTVTAGAPILPTSGGGDDEEQVTETTTEDAGCPTGFYMCEARYLGGCCRVGRDCETTSCPASDTETFISSSGLTIAAGETANSNDACANGWFSCAASDGGDCCPSGYDCGASSCIATNDEEDDRAKQAPNSANVLRWAWSFGALAVVAGIGMVWL